MCYHGMSFTLIAQTSSGIKIKYSEHRKTSQIYGKKIFFNGNGMLFNVSITNSNMFTDEQNKNPLILKILHCRKNLTCALPIDIPYYSHQIFLKISYYSEKRKKLLLLNVEFHHQFEDCETKDKQKYNNIVLANKIQ